MAEANTAPVPMNTTCKAKAVVRCCSGTPSATNARNGSIATLIAPVSSHSITLAAHRLCTLGISTSTTALTSAPASR
jgi:hypothetical protein